MVIIHNASQFLKKNNLLNLTYRDKGRNTQFCSFFNTFFGVSMEFSAVNHTWINYLKSRRHKLNLGVPSGLFQKPAVHTGLNICVFYCYQWVDASNGGLLVPEGIIRPVVNAPTLTRIITYIF